MSKEKMRSPMEIAKALQKHGGWNSMDDMAEAMGFASRHTFISWDRYGNIPTNAIRILMPHLDAARISVREAVLAGSRHYIKNGKVYGFTPPERIKRRKKAAGDGSGGCNTEPLERAGRGGTSLER